MESLLEQLYWGDLRPVATPPKKREDEEKMRALNEKFRSLIDAAAWEAYEEMDTLQNKIEGDLDAWRFANGFKLGALLMMEILT